MLKKTILASASILALASCHREQHYICQCSSHGTLKLHTIGRTTSEQAYNQCKSYEDSVTNCIMEVRK